MNTGSRDEQQMLANIGRIATALERIADAEEKQAEHLRDLRLEVGYIR